MARSVNSRLGYRSGVLYSRKIKSTLDENRKTYFLNYERVKRYIRLEGIARREKCTSRMKR